MNRTFASLFAAAVASGALLAGTTGASALTMQECSVKYQAAKNAGTLGTQNWNQFRASQCGDNAAPAAAAPAAAPARTQAAPAAQPAQQPANPLFPWRRNQQAAPGAAPAAGAAAGAAATVPGDLRTDHNARQRACGAEWKANRDALKAQYGSWPKYWSACNTRMKTTGR